jgi:hypothetical protein
MIFTVEEPAFSVGRSFVALYRIVLESAPFDFAQGRLLSRALPGRADL